MLAVRRLPSTWSVRWMCEWRMKRHIALFTPIHFFLTNACPQVMLSLSVDTMIGLIQHSSGQHRLRISMIQRFGSSNTLSQPHRLQS